MVKLTLIIPSLSYYFQFFIPYLQENISKNGNYFFVPLHHFPHVSCCWLVLFLSTGQLLPELVVSLENLVFTILIHPSEDEPVLAR